MRFFVTSGLESDRASSCPAWDINPQIFHSRPTYAASWHWWRVCTVHGLFVSESRDWQCRVVLVTCLLVEHAYHVTHNKFVIGRFVCVVTNQGLRRSFDAVWHRDQWCDVLISARMWVQWQYVWSGCHDAKLPEVGKLFDFRPTSNGHVLTVAMGWVQAQLVWSGIQEHLTEAHLCTYVQLLIHSCCVRPCIVRRLVDHPLPIITISKPF